MAEPTQAIGPVLKQVQAIVGLDHATYESNKCDLGTSDVFERSERVPAVMVVSPRTTSKTSAVVRLLCEKRVPAMARGAGLSYTGSFAIEQPAVVVETLRMNEIEVNATDRYATVGDQRRENRPERRLARPAPSAERLHLSHAVFHGAGDLRA